MNFNYRDFFIHNHNSLIIKEQLSEKTGNDNHELAQKFCNEFLQHYKVPQSKSNSHNCAWVTQQFIKWAKSKGITAKAIYLVWPDKPDGESHIAPIVNNTILDFTYNQFKSFDDCALLTNVNKWKEVYYEFGYGTNTVKINGKDQSAIIDTFDNLKNIKELGIRPVASLLNV